VRGNLQARFCSRGERSDSLIDCVRRPYLLKEMQGGEPCAVKVGAALGRTAMEVNNFLG